MGKDHPDADIHPEATGMAKATVKVTLIYSRPASHHFFIRQSLTYHQAHSVPAPLVLYSGWFCPFVQRIWIALEEKRIQYQYIEVNPYHKPDSLLSLNPRGLVPTLKWHDKPLYESSLVLQFLDEAYPDHPPRLMPEDVYDKWRVRLWIDFVGSKIIPAFHRFLQCQNRGEELDKKRGEFLGILKEITKAMDGEGPFFLGNEFGMVDIVLVPWAVRLWVFDHFKGGLGMPEKGQGGEDEEVWGRWRKWYEAVSERRSVKETCSEREHLR